MYTENFKENYSIARIIPKNILGWPNLKSFKIAVQNPFETQVFQEALLRY
jgi:hypothetical protein